MALDDSSYNPKIVADSTFQFNTANAGNQAICYLNGIGGLAFERLFNEHEIAQQSGKLFTSIRDGGVSTTITGEIETDDQDKFWRTVNALQTALNGVSTTGKFQLYLHEDGGTNEWRMDNCVRTDLVLHRTEDDKAHRVKDTRYPKWSATIHSEDETPTVISGSATVMGGAASGVATLEAPLKCKGLVIVDDTNTVRGKITYESGVDMCMFRADGEFEVYPGNTVSLPS
jgi:hypothetical protein